jgi:hypothetical protein
MKRKKKGKAVEGEAVGHLGNAVIASYQGDPSRRGSGPREVTIRTMREWKVGGGVGRGVSCGMSREEKGLGGW